MMVAEAELAVAKAQAAALEADIEHDKVRDAIERVKVQAVARDLAWRAAAEQIRPSRSCTARARMRRCRGRSRRTRVVRAAASKTSTASDSDSSDPPGDLARLRAPRLRHLATAGSLS